jgi:hypothetical protein
MLRMARRRPSPLMDGGEPDARHPPRTARWPLHELIVDRPHQGRVLVAPDARDAVERRAADADQRATARERRRRVVGPDQRPPASDPAGA